MHAAGGPHWPHGSHSSTALPMEAHRFRPGVHTGTSGQEQVSHAHVTLHFCVPYVLHDCVPFGAQPWPAHEPLLCQAPLVLHVSVSVPQLPHGTGLVWPGPQVPAHFPVDGLHVEFEQAVPGVCEPFTHDQGVLPPVSQPTWPGAQLPAHEPPLHVLFDEVQEAWSAGDPFTHVHGALLGVSQPVSVGAQVPWHVAVAALQV